MKLLIGCPVYKREWILPLWFEKIEAQTLPLSEIGFVFELGTDDDATHDVLWGWHSQHPEVEVFDGLIREDLKHKTHADNHRTWVRDDYLRMAEMRNSLLDRVVCYDPDAYFSLDSDLILDDPKSLEILLELLQRDEIDAVSPLSYMFPMGRDFPSVMSWIDEPGGRAVRNNNAYLWGAAFQADVIMAAVMMSKPVYQNVRYKWHSQGEDLGWSDEARRGGYKLWCASNVYVEHIMHGWMLDNYLANGVSRSLEIYQ